MGLEYRIETGCVTRGEIPDFLRRHPDFLAERDGMLDLGASREEVLLSVKLDVDHIYLCQHVVSGKSDALFGLLIRRILSMNDQLVIAEL